MAVKDLKPVKVCPECKRTMVAHWSWLYGDRRGAETYWHDGRSGLCRACAQRAERRRFGRRDRQSRRVYTHSPETENLLNEYAFIRDSVNHIKEAASRIGVGYARLDKILYNARKRGDSRGTAPLRQVLHAIDHGTPFGRTSGKEQE